MQACHFFIFIRGFSTNNLHSVMLINKSTENMLTLMYFCSTTTCFDTLVSSSVVRNVKVTNQLRWNHLLLDDFVINLYIKTS